MIQVPVNSHNRINLQNSYRLIIGSYWSMIGHLYTTPVNAQSLICACIVINFLWRSYLLQQSLKVRLDDLTEYCHSVLQIN